MAAVENCRLYMEWNGELRKNVNSIKKNQCTGMALVTTAPVDVAEPELEGAAQKEETKVTR